MAPIVGKLARYAGRALMPGLWNSGLSPNQIYKALRFDYQLSWRRTDMFKDIRQVTGLMKHERQWVDYPVNQKPHQFLFSDVDLPAAQNYRLYAKVDYYNTLTGKTQERMVSFYTDKFNSLNDAENQFRDFFTEKSYSLDEEMRKFTFITGEHNRGAPW